MKTRPIYPNDFVQKAILKYSSRCPNVENELLLQAIELNIHDVYKDTSISGVAYLRNIVHLPFFLQVNQQYQCQISDLSGQFSTALVQMRPYSTYTVSIGFCDYG